MTAKLWGAGKRRRAKPPTHVLGRRVIYEANDSDQWYTPADLRALARRALALPWEHGFTTIDLDPATSSNNPMLARGFYTDRGLIEGWRPPNKGDAWSVWLNPPYGREIKLWSAKLIELAALEPQARILALLPARPGAGWYVRATDPGNGNSDNRAAQLLCELHGRVTYELPDGTPAPYPARWGSVLLYWGPHRLRVAKLLKPRGVVRFGPPCSTRTSGLPADTRQLRLVP